MEREKRTFYLEKVFARDLHTEKDPDTHKKGN